MNIVEKIISRSIMNDIVSFQKVNYKTNIFYFDFIVNFFNLLKWNMIWFFLLLKVSKNYFSINISPNPMISNHFYTFSMLNFSNLQKKLYHFENSHNGATLKIKVWRDRIAANFKTFKYFKSWYLHQFFKYSQYSFLYSKQSISLYNTHFSEFSNSL